MFGSSRSGGVRGGQDQFNWDDVKVDKHRENYLGKSKKRQLKMTHVIFAKQRHTNSCLLTRIARRYIVKTTHRGCFSPPHTFVFTFSIRVPHYALYRLHRCRLSVFVPFPLHKQQVLLFYCPLSIRHKQLHRSMTPLSNCQHARSKY